MTLFDSHCHLNFSDFDQDRDQVLDRCQQLRLTGLCIPATKAADWPYLLNISPRQNPKQYIALGLHPCFMSEHQSEDINQLEEHLQQKHPQVVAVGETGLDFFDKCISDENKTKQTALFNQQVQIAKKHQLPLIIHARKSHDQILKTLRQYKPEAGGIIHGFSGSEQQARQYIELGFKLGFGGGLTYPRATKTRHLASILPMESIVLETDAPDMPLFGYQGQRNSPERLPLIAQCLAKLRKMDVEQVAEQSTQNCHRLLRLTEIEYR